MFLIFFWNLGTFPCFLRYGPFLWIFTQEKTCKPQLRVQGFLYVHQHSLFTKHFKSSTVVLTPCLLGIAFNISHCDGGIQSILLVHWASTNVSALACYRFISSKKERACKLWRITSIILRRILKSFYMPSFIFIIIVPTAEHLGGASSSHFPWVFPQMSMRRCHLSQREEPCLDPKLIKPQSLEWSPGWPVSKTYSFIMFSFIA